MELPKNATEFAIWFGMQFPVVAVSALMARWAVRYTERLHEKRNDENERHHGVLIAEGRSTGRAERKDRRIAG